ncbi:MAG: hypothetical protein JW881_04835 [Spirochaetales bacterium]|nr:hypothetical protein [Spirochaetales bacterium]
MELYFLLKDVIAITGLSASNIRQKIANYSYTVEKQYVNRSKAFIGIKPDASSATSPRVFSYSHIGMLLYTKSKPGKPSGGENKLPQDIDYEAYLKKDHPDVYEKLKALEEKNITIAVVTSMQ